MKLLIILLISLPSFAQPYMGIGLQNKGVNYTAGVLVKNIEIQAQYKMPLSSAIEKSILSFTGGLMFAISNREEDNYSATIQVGAGFRRYRDYNPNDHSLTMPYQDIKPVVGLELGKDAYLGRAVIMVRYCEGFYYGIGLRCFFNR